MAAWIGVTQEDIIARYGPLSAAEQAIVEAVIEDASDIVEERLEASGVHEPINNDRWPRTYVRTVANMVVRVLHNPRGFLSEAVTIDDYRREYRRDAAVSAGVLYVTDAELDALTPQSSRRGGAFTIVLG